MNAKFYIRQLIRDNKSIDEYEIRKQYGLSEIEYKKAYTEALNYLMHLHSAKKEPISYDLFMRLYVEYMRESKQRIHLHKVETFPLWVNKTVKKGKWKLTKTSVDYEEGTKRRAFNTNGYTKALVEYVKIVWNGQSRRVSSEGKWRPDKTHPAGGRYIKSENKGMADITATINGKRVEIEVKGPTDRISDAQRKWQQQIESAGGIYIIATEDFESFQSELISKLNSNLK